MSYWQRLNFWSDTRGQIAVIFTLALPALLAAGGLAVDYAAWTGQARRLQAIADISALTAAKELYLANADAGQVSSVADSVAQAQLALDDTHDAPISVSAQVTNGGDSVEVVLSQDREAYFANFVTKSLAPLQSRAVARALGGGRVCVIVLEESASEAFSVVQKAQLEAVDCAIYSNSTSSSGVFAEKFALVTAELICSAGGAVGGSMHFDPEPTTDCPQIEDPLAGRPAPTYGGCDHNNLLFEEQTLTLSPGVYCGGLSIRKWSNVTFEPGVYVIKDGEFRVDTNATAIGENVSFYLTGNGTSFHFWSNSNIEFTAPKDGPMAGILFFEDRTVTPLTYHRIKSMNARILLGTFYLSRGILDVSTSQPVADQSAWTAIIAKRVELSVQPRLVLNADYGATDIPVPPGVNNTGSTVVLEQ